jgi:hypothetical protein
MQQAIKHIVQRVQGVAAIQIVRHRRPGNDSAWYTAGRVIAGLLPAEGGPTHDTRLTADLSPV